METAQAVRALSALAQEARLGAVGVEVVEQEQRVGNIDSVVPIRIVQREVPALGNRVSFTRQRITAVDEETSQEREGIGDVHNPILITVAGTLATAERTETAVIRSRVFVTMAGEASIAYT